MCVNCDLHMNGNDEALCRASGCVSTTLFMAFSCISGECAPKKRIAKMNKFLTSSVNSIFQFRENYWNDQSKHVNKTQFRPRQRGQTCFGRQEINTDGDAILVEFVSIYMCFPSAETGLSEGTLLRCWRLKVVNRKRHFHQIEFTLPNLLLDGVMWNWLNRLNSLIESTS